ncbi:MAG: hypothetical protein LBQ66_08940 [Planctomycetaceae bacterium]|nr:hypothetical protein [Planctomycetaceae bacterium]
MPVRVPPPLSACADVTARRSVTHLTFANIFGVPFKLVRFYYAQRRA